MLRFVIVFNLLLLSGFLHFIAVLRRSNNLPFPWNQYGLHSRAATSQITMHSVKTNLRQRPQRGPYWLQNSLRRVSKQSSARCRRTIPRLYSWTHWINWPMKTMVAIWEWLPFELPSNVKIVVSTLPDEGGCLNKLGSSLPEEMFVEVGKIIEN